MSICIIQDFQALPDDFAVDSPALFETRNGDRKHPSNRPRPIHPPEIELFDLSTDAFDQSRFARRVRTTMSGRTVWLPTAEDVIVQKLMWAKLANRLKDFLEPTHSRTLDRILPSRSVDSRTAVDTRHHVRERGGETVRSSFREAIAS